MRVFQSKDATAQVFGKYAHCTQHWGLYYADEDFSRGSGVGALKWGSVPAPGELDRRPWRGIAVEVWRRMRGAPRDD